jgi:hypothetical protein
MTETRSTTVAEQRRAPDGQDVPQMATVVARHTLLSTASPRPSCSCTAARLAVWAGCVGRQVNAGLNLTGRIRRGHGRAHTSQVA